MREPIFRGALLGVVAVIAAVSPSNADGPTKAIYLPGDRTFPSGVASAADGTLYVGSAGAGGILQIQPGATQARSWVPPGAFHTHAIFGLFADPRSHTLWACSNELSTRKGSLVGFDLQSGKGKFAADLPSPALCTDVTVAHDGSVYVTNGAAPQILKYDASANRLDVWFGDPRFQPKQGVGLDGVAVSSTDGSVYVDTYTEGKFFRISVENGKPTSAAQMTLTAEMDSDPRPLNSPGALRLIYGDAFLLTEASGRLDRITIEGSAAIINTVHEGLGSASGFAQTDGTTWIAEGQLPLLMGQTGQNPKLPFRMVGIDY